ncbi:MAG: hydrogenase iron-sulfur subunit [bacterium]
MKGKSIKDERVILFYCTRQEPKKFAGLFEIMLDSQNVKEIEAPCSGRVGTGEIMQAIAAGYEKVAVLSCGVKSCVHKFGCIEAKKAMDVARKLAKIAGVDEDRLIFIEADDPASWNK